MFHWQEMQKKRLIVTSCYLIHLTTHNCYMHYTFHIISKDQICWMGSYQYKQQCWLIVPWCCIYVTISLANGFPNYWSIQCRLIIEQWQRIAPYCLVTDNSYRAKFEQNKTSLDAVPPTKASSEWGQIGAWIRQSVTKS